MTVTSADIGVLANALSALAVLITLFYLSRQVRQGNLLARSQVRERMVAQAGEELNVWMDNPDLREMFAREGPLSREEQGKLHYFLLGAMRAREWEWFQHRDGVISDEVHKAYREVVALHLGTPRTRKWWASVGRIGFNPEFVREIDAFLADKPTLGYFEDILTFDDPLAEVTPASSPAGQPVLEP